MNNVQSRDVLNSTYELLEESTSFLLLHPLMLYDIVKKFTS